MKPPTFEEAEPGLRMMLGERRAYITLGELRRQSRVAHLWLQYNEVDISRVAYKVQRRRRQKA